MPAAGQIRQYRLQVLAAAGSTAAAAEAADMLEAMAPPPSGQSKYLFWVASARLLSFQNWKLKGRMCRFSQRKAPCWRRGGTGWCRATLTCWQSSRSALKFKNLCMH